MLSFFGKDTLHLLFIICLLLILPTTTQLHCPVALHRIEAGIPATEEHRAKENRPAAADAGTGKYVAACVAVRFSLLL